MQPPVAVGDRKEVHEACFELLSIEMVDYVVRTSEGSSDHVYSMLERLGFRVGQRLSEKYTRDRGRFQDLLEVIKFICKDFWTEIFRKQIDNLRTNHKGTYMLTDNKFRLFAHMSPTISKDIAINYTHFASGLIRGALANLGIACIVQSEIAAMPACNFTIRIKS